MPDPAPSPAHPSPLPNGWRAEPFRDVYVRDGIRFAHRRVNLTVCVVLDDTIEVEPSPATGLEELSALSEMLRWIERTWQSAWRLSPSASFARGTFAFLAAGARS